MFQSSLRMSNDLKQPSLPERRKSLFKCLSISLLKIHMSSSSENHLAHLLKIKISKLHLKKMLQNVVDSSHFEKATPQAPEGNNTFPIS